MNEEPLHFGSELRRRRAEKGIRLAAFARQVSHSKSHLSKVERGLAVATREFAEVCDNALGAAGELTALVKNDPAKEKRRSKMTRIFGLPAPSSHFVGRSEELDQLVDYLDSASRNSPYVLSGISGVGKTALALQAAWKAAASFPDGCFFLEIEEEESNHTPDILDSLLRMLGVPKGQIPTRPDALANLWRNQLRGRRLLLILDNVRTVAGIAPLLSSEPGCKIIITSRRRLIALDDATHLSIGALDITDGEALFRAIGGERAVCAADRAVRAVVERCDRLPLAIRIAPADSEIPRCGPWQSSKRGCRSRPTGLKCSMTGIGVSTRR